MAKKARKIAASSATKSKQPGKNKIKKATPLKAKKPAPSRAKKGFVNPQSVVKVKIKPVSECNGAQRMKSTNRKRKKNVIVALQTQSDQTPLNGVVMPDDVLKSDKPSQTKKEITKNSRTQTMSEKLQRLNEDVDNAAKQDTAEIRTVVELVKESREDNKAKKIKVKIPRKRSILADLIASEERATTKARKKQMAQQGKRQAKECEINPLEKQVPQQGKRQVEECEINPLEKQVPQQGKRQAKECEINPLEKQVPQQGKRQAKECEINPLEKQVPQQAKRQAKECEMDPLENNISTSIATELDNAQILSYLSLVAKTADFEDFEAKFKNYIDKGVINHTLTGFTWAHEISSTSSAFSRTPSHGYCIPINGKVPIVKLDDFKNSPMAQNTDQYSNSIENNFKIQVGESPCTENINLSSSKHTLSSSVSGLESSKTTTTKNISVHEHADFAKVQNILRNIDFSWIDALDQIFEANDFIKESCNNIMSLSHCMSTDKEELQVACKNLQDTLEVTEIDNEIPLTMTPNLCQTDIVQSNITSVDKEILKKPRNVTSDCITLPVQTNISSDFLNLDDDVISLYAESLATVDLNTVRSKKQTAASIQCLPPIQVRNDKPTVKTLITHTFTKPYEITSAISSTVPHPDLQDDILKIKAGQNPTPAERVVCKKQSADSTSVLRDSKCTDSETNSYCDPQESSPQALTPQKQLDMEENHRDRRISDEVPCSTVPNRIMTQLDTNIFKKTLMSSIKSKLSTIVFTGVCFRNLFDTCRNRNCRYSHRILSPEEINARLSAVGTEICIHSYLMLKRQKVLCDRYLEVFINVFASRKLSSALFEIILDVTYGNIVTNVLDYTLLCLNKLNTLDITDTGDIFLHVLADQSFFSESIILFILGLPYFLVYAPLLSQLLTLFYERNIQLQTGTVHQFVKAICATKMDMERRQFLKLVYEKCVKNTDNRIFSIVPLTDWNQFGQRLTQVKLEAEFEDLWSYIEPRLFDHSLDTYVQRSYPDRPILSKPVAVEPNLLNVNRLQQENNFFIKPLFVRNHMSHRPVYSQRHYGANGSRVKARPPRTMQTKGVAGAHQKFRTNSQHESRFVWPNASTPPG